MEMHITEKQLNYMWGTLFFGTLGGNILAHFGYILLALAWVPWLIVITHILINRKKKTNERMG